MKVKLNLELDVAAENKEELLKALDFVKAEIEDGTTERPNSAKMFFIIFRS